MGRKSRLRKITDYETGFRCAGGVGILREEVWVNGDEAVVRYNLAFLMPYLFAADHGRVLGYDNAHGTHERHFMGRVEPADFHSYAETARRFYREVQTLRKTYERRQ